MYNISVLKSKIGLPNYRPCDPTSRFHFIHPIRSYKGSVSFILSDTIISRYTCSDIRYVSMIRFIWFRPKKLYVSTNFNDQNTLNLSKNVSYEVSVNSNERYDMYRIAKVSIQRYIVIRYRALHPIAKKLMKK